jgi:citronellol/citronellal dehydrogenase
MNRVNFIYSHLAKDDLKGKDNILDKASPKGLKDKTIVITGGSRGIGLAIALRAAKDGANVAILAKTDSPNPKLPGTIYSACQEIGFAGGNGLPLKCDIRFEDNVKECIDKVVATFGGIDILVNNASAINLVDTSSINMKTYDLMNQINSRGTFMVTKYCLPHLKKSTNGHVLNISPPLNMSARWFSSHTAYTMAKYGMSICVLGMSDEFAQFGIAVNALWPKTSIATAAVQNLLGGDGMVKTSRTDAIMADSAYEILTAKSTGCTGNFFVDEEVLRQTGTKCFAKYRVDPNLKEEDLTPDFFLEEVKNT